MDNRLHKDFKLLLNKTSSPYASMDFAFVPTTDNYWRGGVRYSPITNLPGYSFTDSVDNIANISSEGYNVVPAESSMLSFNGLPRAVINESFVLTGVGNLDGGTGNAFIVQCGDWPNRVDIVRNGTDGLRVTHFLAGAGLDKDFISGLCVTGRSAGLYARKGNDSYFGAKAPNGQLQIHSSAGSQALSIPSTKVYMGVQDNGAARLDGKVEIVTARFVLLTLNELIEALHSAYPDNVSAEMIISNAFTASDWNLSGGWSLDGTEAVGTAATDSLRYSPGVIAGQSYRIWLALDVTSGTALRARTGATTVWTSLAVASGLGGVGGVFTAANTGPLDIQADTATFTGRIKAISLRPITLGNMLQNLGLPRPHAATGTVVTDLGNGAYRVSGTPGHAYWIVPTLVGANYRLSGSIDEGGATFWGIRKADDVPATLNVQNASNASSTGSGFVDFAATAGTTYIILQANDGNSVDFSNISLTKL